MKTGSAGNDIYRQLQRHLDNSPEGFPATPSGADIRILKRLFSPEEAQIAILLSPLQPFSVDHIHRLSKKKGLNIPRSQLNRDLSAMVKKGTILAMWENYLEPHYQNAGVSAGGIYDFQVNRLTPELIADFDEYHMQSFTNPPKPGVRNLLPLRTIPVEKSIPLPDIHLTATYEEVRRLVTAAPGPLAVTNCVCRQTLDLKGQKCRHTELRETCLQIGSDHARQYVEMGIAHYVSREEVFEILEKAQKDGLILQPENSQKPEAICCCCGDCCALLSALTRSPKPAALYYSNYFVEVDPQRCLNCGICLKRCHLNARLMIEGKPAVDTDRCIGCGNCVVTCTGRATQLIAKPLKDVPPKDKTDMYRMMLSAKKAG
jgi:Na+-translocating ferredoxin:NAD+ oxidoreductase subunit B